MIDKETYKREIVRMWDSIRDDGYKGIESCSGVTYCDACPLYDIGCGESSNAFEMIKAVEKWSREHPKPKYKISQLEYDILKIYSDDYFYYFYESEVLKLLLKKGYFEGATLGTDVKEYFKNCEVKEDV